ncbi:S-layer homology domain-containing protein [Crassaminicella indica]|uniref:S-layer homology domain-containing protein n=1 Tax=Crassaminicella indica TaxID=2855394 RepID=A0ABX8R8Y5_9CLOT|nr:S-layer homology domain-containing protein [Crassaminicella indica]QXM05261.1 S-layer homology domain-containing protein [Crassaminicella indica]
MKKYISFLLVIMIMCMPITSFANPLTDTITNAVEKGTDVAKDIATHWAKNFIAQLVKDGVFSGYPDGTFRPDANIKVSEFTVLVLKANKIEIEKAEGVWYQGVVNTAINHGIIKRGEFDNYDRYINRGEMTRMIIRALNENPSTGKTHFADDSQIPSHLKGYVKKAVELGIIGGYPDNTFKPFGNATRAESTVVIQKMRDSRNGILKPIDPQPPVVVEPPVVKEPSPITTMPERLYKMPIKCLFDPSTDIREINRKMKAIESHRQAIKKVIQQSKEFIPIYYGFDYRDYSDYKSKCKYYIAGYRKLDGELLTTDESLDILIKNNIKNQIIQKSRFFTSDDLVYLNEKGRKTVRGIIQFKYTSHNNPPKGIEVGKWYEQDIEVVWHQPLLNEGQGNWVHSEILFDTTKYIGQPREIK